MSKTYINKTTWHRWLPTVRTGLLTLIALVGLFLPSAQGGSSQSAASLAPGEAFTSAIHTMAADLFAHVGDPHPETGDLSDGIAFASFVELKNLTYTSSFGRYLAEQLMSEFQQKGYQVIEIRKSTSLTIQEKRGEYGLSRDIAEISPSLAARVLVTGTYTLTGDQILVNARAIDNKNAMLLSSATMSFPRNQVTDLLLADRIKAMPRQRGVASTMVKRLER